MAEQKENREIRALIESSDFDRAFRLCRDRSEKKGRIPSEIFYYGALSLFGLGHIRQAGSWVENFENASPHSVRSLYLKAYQNLHRGKADEALLCYTRILEMDPSDTFADSLIERLRRGEKAIQREIEIPENFKNYFPGFDDAFAESAGVSYSEKKSDRFFLILLLFVLSGLILLGIVIYSVPGLFQKNPFQKFEEKLPEMPSSGSVIPLDKFVHDKPRYIYNESSEALKDYSEARNLILEGRVNSALRKIGKIELSNAGFEIKERASLLREFIPVVDPENFNDSVTTGDVLAEPFILRGAQVIWRGHVVSIQDIGEKHRKIILSQEKTKPPFIVFDVVVERGPLLKKGDEAAVFGIFEKIVAKELIQIKTLRILNQEK